MQKGVYWQPQWKPLGEDGEVFRNSSKWLLHQASTDRCRRISGLNWAHPACQTIDYMKRDLATLRGAVSRKGRSYERFAQGIYAYPHFCWLRNRPMPIDELTFSFEDFRISKGAL